MRKIVKKLNENMLWTNEDRSGYRALKAVLPDGREAYPVMISESVIAQLSNE